MLLIMFSDAEAVLMFVRMMGVRLVLEPLFKKMEEARVRLQVKVVIYHVMSFPSLKNFWVVQYYRMVCFLLKRLLVMGRGKLSSG